MNWQAGAMRTVLANPITQWPTSCEPADGTPRITSGPYQNVTEVTEEWMASERERVLVPIEEI